MHTCLPADRHPAVSARGEDCKSWDPFFKISFLGLMNGIGENHRRV